jgi:hypothetical protein
MCRYFTYVLVELCYYDYVDYPNLMCVIIQSYAMQYRLTHEI